jgi:hypothetical protein
MPQKVDENITPLEKTTVQDILNDIEFEIAQGMISKEALGPALESVRQFQNRLRSETFKAIRLNDPYREVVSRQFQTIDMLLALLQEMALRIQTLQAALENLHHFPSTPPKTSTTDSQTVGAPQSNPPISPRLLSDQTSANASGAKLRSQDEILQAIRPETISVSLQARRIRWPIIGRLLTRLRIFYQRPALYYTSLLSERQAPVNRILGDRILYLEALLKDQQEQIQALKALAAMNAANTPENPTVPHQKEN